MGTGNWIGEPFGNIDVSDENTILADSWLDFVVAREGNLTVKQSSLPRQELDNGVQDFSKGVENPPDGHPLMQSEIGRVDRENDSRGRQESATDSAGIHFQEPSDPTGITDDLQPPDPSNEEP